MLQQIDSWEQDRIELPVLTKNLYGLLKASEMDASPVGEGFYDRWAELDGETELRTEPWAPPGAASDERLAEIIAGLREYVRNVVAGGSVD